MVVWSFGPLFQELMDSMVMSMVKLQARLKLLGSEGACGMTLRGIKYSTKEYLARAVLILPHLHKPKTKISMCIYIYTCRYTHQGARREMTAYTCLRMCMCMEKLAKCRRVVWR